MKASLLLGLGAAVLLAIVSSGPHLRAASETTSLEYATLRWDGRDFTHLIRPNGTVENLRAKFAGIKKPDHTDDRSFFMNIAMNSLSKEGYELVAMTPDDYVFRRAVRP